MKNKMYEALMAETFNMKYDKFDLEIKVRKIQTEHVVKCNFRSKGNYKEAFNSIFRFFNELVWFYNIKVRDINGGHSHGSHVQLNYSVNDGCYLLYFTQKVFDERQHLALAFFREALCNESPYYRFLCFDKILQIPFKQKQAKLKAQWIESQLLQLKDESAINFRDIQFKRIKNLENKSLASWLYKDGRQALAHAYSDEFVRDPSSYDDWDEVKWANTVMQDLAKKCIIDKLRVPTP